MPLPEKDIEHIKERVIKKAKAELIIRMSKGYENIDICLIESVLDNILSETETS